MQERRWDWIYDRVIQYEDGTTTNPPLVASRHTSKEWRIQIEPEFNADHHRRATARVFDVNNRMISEQTGLIQLPGYLPGVNLQSVQGITEMHSVTYDPNGQKSTSTDPLGRVTSYGYDRRNRLETTTEPNRQGQEHPVTKFDYDVAGNKTMVTFPGPEHNTQEWGDYGAFGQAWTFTNENHKITNLTYKWGPMKKLDTVRTYREKDHPGGTEVQLTSFDYDGMGRPTWTIFPDGSRELNAYELGQLSAFKTRKDQTKRLHYDARGREDYHTWDAGAAPRIDRVWDDANRMTKIWNNVSIIDYSYDEAGQVRMEGTTVTGSALREVRYCRYPSGDVSQITYPNGTVITRFYTARGQLKDVGWGAGATSYVYHPDGKVDYQARTNQVTTSYGYDGRGLIGSLRHSKSDYDLAKRDYWRDDRDRILAWKRGTDTPHNGLEDGRGNRYKYDDEGQLERAWYRALNPETAEPFDPKRGDNFHYDELGNRKDWNDVASRGAMLFKRKNNGLNQYFSWENSHPNAPLHWGTTTNYDDDVGGGWGAPGAANGVLMQDGWITAGFNALNQPICMWSPVYQGGPSAPWMWFGYDPLGRCVKRWVGPSGSPPPNLAMYFYYDGWNLIQEGGASEPVPNRLYVHGGRVDEIVASWGSGQWSNHHYDAQGNCIMLTDPSGLIREQYDYDAFGRPYFYNAVGNSMGSSSMYGNRFLFTGREWLKEMKVYDYRNRMYQPELGRFLQPDPKQFAAGDYNLYRYCHNDPVNRSDPTGLQSPTAATWNRLMWERSGSGLSSSDFNTVKQGEAWIAPPTGNYKDNNIDNHKDPHPNPNKPGRTVYNIEKSEHVGGMLIFRPTLDWWVRADSMNTKVIAGELEHVQRWLYWQSKGDGGAFVRNFNRNHPYGFDQLRAKMGGEYDDEFRYQENNIHAHNRHVTSENPQLNEKMTPEQIQNAIRSIAPQEEPQMINPYLKY